MNWMCIGITILSFALGVLVDRFVRRVKSIGNLLVIFDPDDGQKYLFLEVDKSESLDIRNNDIVTLTVRSGTASRN